MKLIIRQYLNSLRERDELDAVLPDLLSELGFEVLTRPRRGTRQHGVDVAAVGPDPDDNDRRTLFLFTVKSGDLDRQTWNGGQQAVRQSLEDVLDGYIPHRIPGQYTDLPIAICLCMGGEMREDLRDTWTGFTGARTTERICFREWNGDRLAQFLMTGVLRQDILGEKNRAHFHKALAMLDQPDVAYRHFASLISGLLAETDGDRTTTRSLRQAYICLWVLYVWARDQENLETPYRASELLLLHAWPFCNPERSTKAAVRKDRSAIINQLLLLHLGIAELFVSKVEPHAGSRLALSIAVASQASLDINLALFETLGRIVMQGIWSHWIGMAEADPEIRVTAIAKRDQALRVAIQIINANSTLLSPRKDDFAVEIALLMYLAQLCGRVGDVADYLRGMAHRLHYSLLARDCYPVPSSQYRELATPADRNDNAFRDRTKASVLYPLIMTWLDWLDATHEREVLAGTLAEQLPHTTQQVWLLDDTSDEAIWRGGHDHGVAIPGLPVSGPASNLHALLERACEDHSAISGMSVMRRGVWPLLLAACRHYRLPVPPQLWQPLPTEAQATNLEEA